LQRFAEILGAKLWRKGTIGYGPKLWLTSFALVISIGSAASKDIISLYFLWITIKNIFFLAMFFKVHQGLNSPNLDAKISLT
jgi:hypothetical protein